jgi:hypothetical protein
LLQCCASANRGRREDRVHAAPAVSCASCTKKCAHEHTGSAETIRPSLRNGFNGFLRALPGDEFLLSPSSRGLMALLEARLGPQNLRGLDTSNGCQNHTTSPSATCAARPRAGWLLTGSVEEPPCHRLARRRLCVHRTRTTFVTIAKRPSFGRDGASL